MRMLTIEEHATNHTPTDHARVAPAPSPSSPHSPTPSDHALTPHLLHDLLDPNTTPMQICEIHNITLDQLAAIMDSTAYHQAAAAIKRIAHQRQDLINDHTHLQDLALQRAIANDAYLAATDMDQAAASRDPKRAAIKARYLETARKATRRPHTTSKDADYSKADPPLLPRESKIRPRRNGGGAEQSEAEGVSFDSTERWRSATGGLFPLPQVPKILPRPDGGGAEQSEAEGASCDSSEMCRSANGGATKGGFSYDADMGDEKSYRNAKIANTAARSNARALRKRMTPPERALWVVLRGRKVAGLKFRRQAPIGPYIADFYCHEARLVVEVDGSTHQGSQVAHDRNRDEWMRERGIRVLRVSARDVLQNIDGVVRKIMSDAGEPPPSR